MIEAPHAASRHCEIEKHEAVDEIANSPAFRSGKKPLGACAMKYAKAMSPARMNATGRVNNPSTMSTPPTKLNHAVDARERHGGHSRRGRNWQAKIFRHPMLQEQQADHD